MLNQRVNYVEPYTLVIIPGGQFAIAPNRPARRDSYSYRTNLNHATILRASDQVQELAYPAAIAFDELLRHLDRTCNDGSHI